MTQRHRKIQNKIKQALRESMPPDLFAAEWERLCHHENDGYVAKMLNDFGCKKGQARSITLTRLEELLQGLNRHYGMTLTPADIVFRYCTPRDIQALPARSGFSSLHPPDVPVRDLVYETALADVDAAVQLLRETHSPEALQLLLETVHQVPQAVE